MVDALVLKNRLFNFVSILFCSCRLQVRSLGLHPGEDGSSPFRSTKQRRSSIADYAPPCLGGLRGFESLLRREVTQLGSGETGSHTRL